METLFVAKRLKASGIHFLVSCVCVAVALLASALFWYPGPLAFAAGLAGIVGILVMVDLVLGPVLTFVVYKPGKKSLKLDLAVIAAVQILALGYGLQTVYQARPVYIVFSVDRFETVSAADLEPASLAQAEDQYRELSRTGPRWVGVRLPDDPRVLQELTVAEAVMGTGPSLLPQYYDDYDRTVKAGLGKARALDELKKFNPESRVAHVLSKISREPSELLYFPLKSVDSDLSVIVDARTGQKVDVVDLRPWG